MVNQMISEGTLTITEHEFAAQFNALDAAMLFVANSTLHLPESAAYDLQLACEEIFLNIISYAYPNYIAHQLGRIIITWADDPVQRKTTVTFTDTGIPFNPLATDDPDLTSPLTRRRVGGLGIMLVRNKMNVVQYERLGDRNVLLITKNWDK